jgi:hypothetical protein
LGLESVDGTLPEDSFAIPEWVREFVPALATGMGWTTYHWAGAAPMVEFRTTRDSSAKAAVDLAQFDIWLASDGSITGWLGMKLSENIPAELELDWPFGAQPTALDVAGEFVALPPLESGNWTVPIPPTAKGGRVWLSWSDRGNSLPALSEPLAARVPWPRSVPVDRCSMSFHSPANFRIDAAPPFVATARPQADALPPLISTEGERSTSPGADLFLALSPVPRPGSDAAVNPGAGFELGNALRVVNERPRRLLLAIAAALLLSGVCWKTTPFWGWLTRHETSAWLALSVLWCLWLDPSWFGLVIALCACARVLVRRDRPLSA